MTSKPVQPGDTVWVLSAYTNEVKCGTAISISPFGLKTNKHGGYVTFDRAFDSEAEAMQGMVARAERQVKDAEDEVKRAEDRLARAKQALEKFQCRASASA